MASEPGHMPNTARLIDRHRKYKLDQLDVAKRIVRDAEEALRCSGELPGIGADEKIRIDEALTDLDVAWGLLDEVWSRRLAFDG